MDRYRSPQSFTSAAISISQPRPLRAHGQDESTTTSMTNTPATGNYALPRHTPVIPHSRTAVYAAQHELPADEVGMLQSPEMSQGGLRTLRSEESRLDSDYRGSWMGRGFLGTLMHGLRKTRKAMDKHHSRQSLYEEYAAEAHATSLRNSRMSPDMRRPLEGIPESVDGDIVESSRGQSSQDTYEGTTAVNHDPAWPQPVWPIMGSPGYTNSQLTSEYSKRASSLGPLPPDDTWAYYYARIVHFLIWLRDLPWSEERIVSDYIPARDGRGGFGAERPVNAWYKPKNKKGQMDNEKFSSSVSPPVVLVVPATPPSGGSYGFGVAPPPSLPSMGPPVLPTPVLPSPFSDGAVTAIRPTHTPVSATSAGLSYMSPGMSSHGAGRQELTYSWYSGSPVPQQWPNFSQFSSPQTQAQTRLGTNAYPSDGRYIDR